MVFISLQVKLLKHIDMYNNTNYRRMAFWDFVVYYKDKTLFTCRALFNECNMTAFISKYCYILQIFKDM